MECKMD